MLPVFVAQNTVCNLTERETLTVTCDSLQAWTFIVTIMHTVARVATSDAVFYFTMFLALQWHLKLRIINPPQGDDVRDPGLPSARNDRRGLA